MSRARGTASAGRGPVAYEVLGTGPETLVVVPPWVTHLDYDWQTPEIRSYYEALARGRRVVRYDKRGTGCSSRDVTTDDCTPEAQMRDCLAVMDAIGVGRAALFATSEGGPMALTLAATYPERVDRLVLYGSYARIRGGEDHPIGLPSGDAEAIIRLIRAEWGLGSRILSAIFIPEGDPAKSAWFTAYQRIAATADAAIALLESAFALDVRALLARIPCPVLVLHHRQDPVVPFAQAEYLAKHLPDARLEPLEGHQHIPYFSDTTALLGAIERFLPAPMVPNEALSAREIEVLTAVADGLSNREVGARLCVSEATVVRHLANISAKTGTTGRAGAVAYAFRHHLI